MSYSTFEAHLKSLEQMFSALQVAGLTLSTLAMSFRKKSISISADRIKAILALPEPDCIKDNRGFLRTLNYVCRFIDGYAEITAPLVELTRKDFVKNDRIQEGFWTRAT